MKYQMPTVKQLAELAQEADLKDPVDWGLLTVDEKTAYSLMAASVLEQFSNVKEPEQLTVAMATITKLLVENFVLNLRLEGKL
jgi:hypothetical protein